MRKKRKETDGPRLQKTAGARCLVHDPVQPRVRRAARSPRLAKWNTARPSSLAVLMPAAAKPPATAAEMPAKASSTTRQRAGGEPQLSGGQKEYLRVWLGTGDLGAVRHRVKETAEAQPGQDEAGVAAGRAHRQFQTHSPQGSQRLLCVLRKVGGGKPRQQRPVAVATTRSALTACSAIRSSNRRTPFC